MNGWFVFLVFALVCFRGVRCISERDGQLLVVLAGLFFLSISCAGLAQYAWGIWGILLIVSWMLARILKAARATSWRPPSPPPRVVYSQWSSADAPPRGLSPEGTYRVVPRHTAVQRFTPRPADPPERAQSWREAFVTCLLLLSAFALVFAASKLPLTVWWPASHP
jgi:hypothetical protein